MHDGRNQQGADEQGVSQHGEPESEAELLQHPGAADEERPANGAGRGAAVRGGGDPEQAREALAVIETTTRRSLREMRLLVSVLRDPGRQDAELSPAPGLSGLGRLVADADAAGVAVALEIDGTVRPLSPAADLSAYRIVQEALTNVVRHAAPTRARIRLSYRTDELAIEVTDDGPAGDRSPQVTRAGGGHGLIGMRERAALFGGELAAGPYGAGFRIAASIPVSEFRAGELPHELAADAGAR